MFVNEYGTNWQCEVLMYKAKDCQCLVHQPLYFILPWFCPCSAAFPLFRSQCCKRNRKCIPRVESAGWVFFRSGVTSFDSFVCQSVRTLEWDRFQLKILLTACEVRNNLLESENFLWPGLSVWAGSFTVMILSEHLFHLDSKCHEWSQFGH